MQNGRFRSKIKNAKKIVWVEKRLYDHIKVVVCKKPLQKTPETIRKMDSILKMAKIGHDAWAIAIMQNGQFRSKIKNAKKVRKTIVRPH